VQARRVRSASPAWLPERAEHSVRGFIWDGRP
jgi:hypothetical protein